MSSTEPRVLARYDPTTPANIAFRQAQRNAPDRQLLLDLGQLRMALQDIEDRYSTYLHSGRLLSAQVEDRLRMLVLQEISAIEAILVQSNA